MAENQEEDFTAMIESINKGVLHHVGIVVHDEEIVRKLSSIFGLEESYRGYVRKYNALCIFMKGNGATPIEFIVPNGGKLANFNNGRGGLHHLAFTTKDIREMKKFLEEKGIELIEEQPVRGAGEFIVNFTKPKTTNHILIELVEEL